MAIFALVIPASYRSGAGGVGPLQAPEGAAAPASVAIYDIVFLENL